MISLARRLSIVVCVLFLIGTASSIVMGGNNLFAASLGVVLYCAPLYLAARALHPERTDLRAIATAYRANMWLAALLLVGAIALAISAGGGERTLSPALVLLGVAAVYPLNLFALRRRERQVELELEMQYDEPPSAAHRSVAPDASRRIEPTLERADAAGDAVANTPVSIWDRPLNPAAPPTTVPPEEPRGNYFVRHWRGQLSLAVSYWVNGSLLAGVFAAAFVFAAGSLENLGASLRVSSASILFSLIVALALWIWAVVGIWRSADEHPNRGGSNGWAVAAKVMVVLGFLANARLIAVELAPAAREFALISMGADPLGKVALTIGADGRSIVVHGPLGEGAAAKLDDLLAVAPAVRTLVLNSNGGRLGEAARMAEAVRTRALNTYVEGQCESACTMVLLAGADRAATPGAKIGFHQPAAVGGREIDKAHDSPMLQAYRAAALPAEFIERVSNTAHADIWYPTRAELLEAGVLTRVSLGGEAATLAIRYASENDVVQALRAEPLWRAIDHRFPGTMNNVARSMWAAIERGGSDSDVAAAARAHIATLTPRILADAAPDVLVEYFEVSISQLEAARDVSVEACSQLLAAELSTSTLPVELIKREQQLLSKAVLQPLGRIESLDAARLAQLTTGVLARLPVEHQQTLSRYEAETAPAQAWCDANIAYVHAVNELPLDERVLVLRSLYQAEEG